MRLTSEMIREWPEFGMNATINHSATKTYTRELPEDSRFGSEGQELHSVVDIVFS